MEFIKKIFFIALRVKISTTQEPVISNQGWLTILMLRFKILVHPGPEMTSFSIIYIKEN